METMEAIKCRQSCRAYTEEQLTERELTTLLEAANAAPIGMALYENVKLTVIQNPDILSKLDAATAKFYQHPDARPTYGAPTVILVSAIKEDQKPTPYCNTACIIENMAIAATDLGLGSVYLLGMIPAIAADDELCKELMVPQGFVPTSAIALGKSAQPIKEKTLTINKIATDYIK